MAMEVPLTLRTMGIALAVLIAIVIGWYAVNALAAAAVTIVVLIVGGFVAWVILGRIWDRFRHGKPLYRAEGGGEGGDA